MTTLRDFSDFNAEPLVLPINGKRYTVPPVSSQDGIAMSVLIEKVDAILNDQDPDPNLVAFDDEGEKDLYKRALGSLWDELVADNVPLTALRLAGMVAFADFAKGREAATALWEGIVSSGGDAQGEAVTPNRATRRAASKTRSGRAGAAATSAKTRASGSGTRSRRKSSPTEQPETKD